MLTIRDNIKDNLEGQKVQLKKYIELYVLEQQRNFMYNFIEEHKYNVELDKLRLINKPHFPYPLIIHAMNYDPPDTDNMYNNELRGQIKITKYFIKIYTHALKQFDEEYEKIKPLINKVNMLSYDLRCYIADFIEY